MNPDERVKLIQTRLTAAFHPSQLMVIDDSAKHRGHPGSLGGAGHYTVQIAAGCFKDQTRVNAHRLIYAALEDLIPHEIHALSIQLLSSD